MEQYINLIKTGALCAVVALGVGATSASAGSLLTSAKIKDGTIAMRDLSPSLQAKIKRAGTPGTPGTAGAAGANGANGVDGASGARGETGANGRDGQKGRDGVRYDRLTGETGEFAIGDGVARLTVPTQDSWAQVRTYPQNMKLSEIKKLSFRSNSTHSGVVYLKITTEGNHTVVFSPITQPAGETGVGSWATHDVLGGVVRFDDDGGSVEGQYGINGAAWAQLIADHGDLQIKDVRVTGGASGPVGDGALVQVDDLTINNEVIDFS